MTDDDQAELDARADEAFLAAVFPESRAPRALPEPVSGRNVGGSNGRNADPPLPLLLGDADAAAPVYFLKSTPPVGLPPELADHPAGILAQEIHEKWSPPPILAVATALGVAAAAAKGKIRVNVNGYLAPLNLYVAALAPPGGMKSAVLDAVADPLATLQQDLLVEKAPETAAQRSRKTAIEQQVTVLEKRMGQLYAERCTTAEEKAEREVNVNELEVLLKEAHKELIDAQPQGWHFVVKGAELTYEAVIKHAADNQGRFFAITDEGGIVENLSGRYSDDKARTELFNVGYDGGTFNGNRISDTGRSIPSVHTGLTLVIQPDVFDGVVRNHFMAKRGFLQRFLPFYAGVAPYRSRFELAGLHADAVDRWSNAIEGVWKQEERTIRLPKRSRLADFERAVIQPMADRAAANDQAALNGWLSKLAMTGARIAALLELLEDPQSEEVTTANAERAVAVLRIAVANADHYLGDAEPDSQVTARRRTLEAVLKTAVLGKYPQYPQNRDSGYGELKSGYQNGGFGDIESIALNLNSENSELVPAFSTRRVYQIVRKQTSWVNTVRDVRDQLQSLEDLGWVRQVQIPRHGPGRPSEHWQAHPDIKQHYDAMTARCEG